MILPKLSDSLHKAWLYRLLLQICDNEILSKYFHFKGGTCASMLGYLDRFSVDLDFDMKDALGKETIIRNELESIFKKLSLKIKDSSENILQYFLKYDSKPRMRNTLKIDVSNIVPKNNKYHLVKLHEIDRFISCQTIETMFSNKLVGLLDRYEKNNSIAGRDLYDIHHFFIEGYYFNHKIIEERRGTSKKAFFKELIDFIENKITQTQINQDLNALLTPKQFKTIRSILKDEVLMFLRGFV